MHQIGDERQADTLPESIHVFQQRPVQRERGELPFKGVGPLAQIRRLRRMDVARRREHVRERHGDVRRA
ncbi:hypothetical protein D3C83_50350 [compost metagenome]